MKNTCLSESLVFTYIWLFAAGPLNLSKTATRNKKQGLLGVRPPPFFLLNIYKKSLLKAEVLMINITLQETGPES